MGNLPIKRLKKCLSHIEQIIVPEDVFGRRGSKLSLIGGVRGKFMVNDQRARGVYGHESLYGNLRSKVRSLIMIYNSFCILLII